LLIILALFCPALARDNESNIPRYNGDYLEKIRTDRLITPALPFAKPLAGGPLRVLFLIPKAGAIPRDVVEMWERLDLTYEAVTLYAGQRIADDFPFTTAVVGESTPEKVRELNEKLDGSYDVICLADFCFDALPASCQYKVLSAVRGGTGVLGVFANTRSAQSIYQPLTPPIPGHEVLRGCALVGLPYFNIADPQQRDAVADRMLTTAHFGKGRIAWLNYDAPVNLGNWYAGDCFGRPVERIPTSQGYDAALGITARALLWAAGREPAVRIVPAIADGAVIAHVDWPKAFTGKLLASHGAIPDDITMQALLVRPDNTFAQTGQVSLTKTDQGVTFAVALPPAPHGTAFLYLIAKDAQGAVIDWTTTTLTINAPSAIATLATDPEVANPNDTVTVTATLRGALPANGRVRLEAVDNYERVFFRREATASPNLRFAVPLAPARGRAVSLRLWLSDGATLLDTRLVECFIKRQVGNEFINLIWGHPGIGPRDYHARGYLNLLMGKQLQQADFNTGMLFPTNGAEEVALGSKALSRTDAHWMIYAAHVSGASIRAQTFDAEARAKEEKQLETLGVFAKPFGPYVYSLGDEDNYSVFEDLQPRELAVYRHYLHEAYAGDVAALNRAWSSAYASFDALEVAPPAGQPWSVSRRYDLRSFWEQMYADTLHWKRAAIRRGDPQAQVGAEGSLPGNLELTISQLDWWAPYEDRFTNAQLRFWVPQDSLRGNWWGGYTANQGARCGPQILWHQLATSSVNASHFFVASIAAEAMFSTDLDYADYFTPWLADMREICERAGPLLRASQPVDDSVGIYWSRRGEIANELDQRFGSGFSAQNELINLFDALGVNAKFVTERQILAGKLSPATTRVLFLCVAKAIPDALAPALETYVKAGGVVIADVATDLRDSHAAQVAPGRLLPLFGAKATGQPKPITADIAFAGVKLRGSVVSLQAHGCVLDAAVTAGNSTALAAAGKTPIMIARQSGKGLAVLLNYDLYHALRMARSTKSATTPGADFLLALLKVAGVQPAYPPLPGLPWETVRRFQLADAVIIGLDGPQHGQATRVVPVTPQDTVHLLRPGISTDTIGQLLLPADHPETILFAVLPPAKRQISITGPLRGKAGETLRYDVALRVGGKPLAGSLLRIDLYAPTGVYLRAHRQFVKSMATPLALDVPLALNAPPGRYTLRITELVSGATATSALDLAEAVALKTPILSMQTMNDPPSAINN
ncbi:MAG TPA: hypothetical protein VGL77_21435, partial [Armatimonadota bacterium]